MKLKGASGNNLRNVNLDLPIGVMTCVTGVSGSGKSTLINDTLFRIAHRELNKATESTPAPYRSVEGLEHLDKVVDIDQSPIGRTPRSNPATYTGLFTPIRELLSGTQEARSRGYQPGRFSFNVKGGRCEACQGDGVIKVEMHFLPDVYVPCDVCKGKRYNRETLEVKYKGKNIHEILDMTVEDAREFFDPVPAVARKLQTLMDVGLSTFALVSQRPLSLVARRSGSSWRGSSPSGIPVRPSIFWTSRPPGCTSTTSSNCSRYCTSCGIAAIPSSSLSTTWTW